MPIDVGGGKGVVVSDCWVQKLETIYIWESLGSEAMGHLPSALLSSTSGQAVLKVTVLSSECLPRVSTAYRVNLQHSKKTQHRAVASEKPRTSNAKRKPNHSTGVVGNTQAAGEMISQKKR